MNRSRLVVVALLVLGQAIAGCDGPDRAPGTPAPGPVGSEPVPPKELCDLLSAADFATHAGLTVNPPTTDNATATVASCIYGVDVEMDVFVHATPAEAEETYDVLLREGPVMVTATNLIAAVDESAAGSITAGGTTSYTMSLRRRKLVIALELPGGTPDPQVKLLKLAGAALQRAAGLGA